ncbi:MAG: hypothetical protein WAO00_08535 [Chthoniobacterales bacterium]
MTERWNMRGVLLHLFALFFCIRGGATTVPAQVNDLNGSQGARLFVKLSSNRASTALPREISLADRIAYQREIEEVYWRPEEGNLKLFLILRTVA